METLRRFLERKLQKREIRPRPMISGNVIAKDINTEEEFFWPTDGLEVEPYLVSGNLQGIHHLGRYHWVKTVLRDIGAKKILDVACGVGYGSYLLADFLPDAQITGADYDTRAISIARREYKRENLRYIPGDLVSWTSNEEGDEVTLGEYEAIVCFDTIEHIAHRDIALLRITENLRANGILALSTPCGHSQTRLRPEWAAHKIEYSGRDLKKTLNHYFEHLLTPEDNSLPNQGFWDNVINKDKVRYLNLANPLICKNPIVF